MNIFDVAETTIKLPLKELSLHQRFVELSKARSVIGHSGTNKCQCRGLGLDTTDYLLCNNVSSCGAIDSDLSRTLSRTRLRKC